MEVAEGLKKAYHGHWVKGQSGNLRGRRKDGKIGVLGQNRKDLQAAVKSAEKRRGKKIMMHMVERAFEDTTVLVALMKKLVPDLKSVDITTDRESARQVIIMNFADYIKKVKSKEVETISTGIEQEKD